MGSEDEEQVGLFIQKKFSVDAIAKIGHGHIKCSEIKPVLDDKIWNEFFKFAVVRNPWDKYISFCAFMNRKNDDFVKDPKKIVHDIIDRPKAKQRILFRPQYEFLCDEHGDIMVDYVGKFEELQKVYDHVAQEIKVETSKLEEINSSVHEHYSIYYDDELKEKVAQFYQRDIELFNYSFDDKKVNYSV